jgi:hypothetical protein
MLKIYHNFESYQNMLIVLPFCFFYHKKQLFFVCHAHYTSFICGKDSWKLKFLKILWIFKIEKFDIFLIVSDFWTWVVGCYHLNFFTIKIMLLQ